MSLSRVASPFLRATLVKPTVSRSQLFAPVLSGVRCFANQPAAKPKARATKPGGTVTNQIDIHKLNAIESQAAQDESPMARSGAMEQEGETEIDVPADGANTSHLTFTDIPLSEVLAGKQKYGTSIHAVSDTDKISSAMSIITEYNIGAVLVRSSSNPDDIVGIISTRDYLEHVGEGIDPRNSSVKDFMTESPVFAFSDDKAIPCLELMTKHNFRHLPVRDRATGKPIGLVSIGDLVRNMLRQYRESNVFLKDYIDGKYH